MDMPISPQMFRDSHGYDQYGNGYGENSDRARFHDLNGSQCMVVFSSLLEKFKDQMEEAKLRCEDEDDDTSLGEYISLQSVVEQMEKFLGAIPRQEYSKSHLDNYLRKSPGYDLYTRMSGKY